jgi:hypothetical protein
VTPEDWSLLDEMAMGTEADAAWDVNRGVAGVAGEAWWYPWMGYAAGKSRTVGEKFVRVVGFGASSDSGGLVLGFSIGGESGSGVRCGRCCFGGPDVTYILPFGDIMVEGGDNGIEPGGYE